ncbi:hypothetical protein LTR85_009004 [Meristemomyces frigidus]|nr:hypothetical protein LTR85_009004 [Meristemomyces frigidus]
MLTTPTAPRHPSAQQQRSQAASAPTFIPLTKYGKIEYAEWRKQESDSHGRRRRRVHSTGRRGGGGDDSEAHGGRKVDGKVSERIMVVLPYGHDAL